jgi:hypothetical protein
MKHVKKIVWGLGIILTLMAVQILTFNTIAINRLTGQLLPEDFSPITYSEEPFDSAFVRDFFVTDCISSPIILHSHNLETHNTLLKKKLGVTFIEFQDESEYLWTPPAEKKHKLIYHTWMWTSSSWRLRDLFTATQVEEMIIDHKNTHRRIMTYRWILFDWTEMSDKTESIIKV